MSSQTTPFRAVRNDSDFPILETVPTPQQPSASTASTSTAAAANTTAASTSSTTRRRPTQELPTLNAPRHVLPGLSRPNPSATPGATAANNTGVHFYYYNGPNGTTRLPNAGGINSSNIPTVNNNNAQASSSGPVNPLNPNSATGTNASPPPPPPSGTAVPPLQSTVTPSFVMAPAPDPCMRPLFESAVKCRWIAGFILFYYLLTFFFLQPLFLSTMGILTGFCGIVACRDPIDGTRLKWLRGFIYLHYLMGFFNVCLLLTAALYGSQYSSHDLHPMLCMALIIGTNLLLHYRGERAGRAFLGELLRLNLVDSSSQATAVFVVQV